MSYQGPAWLPVGPVLARARLPASALVVVAADVICCVGAGAGARRGVGWRRSAAWCRAAWCGTGRRERRATAQAADGGCVTRGATWPGRATGVQSARRGCGPSRHAGTRPGALGAAGCGVAASGCSGWPPAQSRPRYIIRWTPTPPIAAGRMLRGALTARLGDRGGRYLVSVARCLAPCVRPKAQPEA